MDIIGKLSPLENSHNKTLSYRMFYSHNDLTEHVLKILRTVKQSCVCHTDCMCSRLCSRHVTKTSIIHSNCKFNLVSHYIVPALSIL